MYLTCHKKKSWPRVDIRICLGCQKNKKCRPYHEKIKAYAALNDRDGRRDKEADRR